MDFQLNTDSNIKGDERLAEVAEEIVAAGLGHLTDRLSRIEVYLADVNAAKGGVGIYYQVGRIGDALARTSLLYRRIGLLGYRG